MYPIEHRGQKERPTASQRELGQGDLVGESERLEECHGEDHLTQHQEHRVVERVRVEHGLVHERHRQGAAAVQERNEHSLEAVLRRGRR